MHSCSRHGQSDVVSLARPARGSGSRMLAAVERAAVDAGCQRIWLTTTNDNLGGLRFFQRRGFRIRAVRPGAVDLARATLKPEITAIGSHGIAMRDEIDLELELGSPEVAGADTHRYPCDRPMRIRSAPR